uniref:Small ribosomal subunit protein eS8 n=1 Tax=Mus spicilegus TaxID=10103 RepID=A0A8C6N061_MUSSI
GGSVLGLEASCGTAGSGDPGLGHGARGSQASAERWASLGTTGTSAARPGIGPRLIHTVRVRGGNKKYRALRLDVGNFSWGSECCTRKTRIIDVVYNASNNDIVRTKTLVKNCIMLIDSTPYRQWYESHYALPLGRKKGAKLTPEEEEILNKKRSKKIQKKYDKSKKNAKISSLLEEQFQ